MNQPPEEFVLVQEDRLLAFVTACFEKSGIDEEHAALIARLLVNADLRGVRSHGSSNTLGYAKGFERGSFNPQPNIEIVRETPTVAVFDGDGTLGYLPMVRAAEKAVEKARATGMGMGLVRHIGHYGSAGHYARICLEAGCVGFSVQGYRSEGTVVDGGEPRPSAGFSGNPPICFAIPGGDEPDMVLDAGASVFASYSGDGQEELLERFPSAFFRSMGFIAVSTLLGGNLTGYATPEAAAINQQWSGADHGGMVMAIDIAQIVDIDTFRAEFDRYARDLRANYTPIPGTDIAWLPGATEQQRLERYRAEGIRFGDRELESSRKSSEHFGVPLPWD